MSPKDTDLLSKRLGVLEALTNARLRMVNILNTPVSAQMDVAKLTGIAQECNAALEGNEAANQALSGVLTRTVSQKFKALGDADPRLSHASWLAP